MALDKNFRSALNGFNRSDVVHYIEESTIAQEKALRQLRDENTKLRTAMDKLRAEKDELSEALTVTGASADTQSAAPTPDAQQDAAPAQAPVPPAVHVPSEQELSAYRRAEATERNARLRARKLCRQVNEIMENAATKMEESSDDVQTLMQDLSINLRRLTDTFAALKLTFDDTSAAFEDIDPMDTSEFES